MARIAAALLAVFLLTGCAGSAGASSNPVQVALDHARARTHAPAATAAIMVDGKLVWAGSSGVRDLRRGGRVTRQTPFVLASVTKTVTATMIMQVVQEGRLSVDQPLADFYPRLPNAATITVRMLLNHTSGLAAYEDNARLNALSENDPAHHWTRDEVIAAVGAPQFAPGARYEYTNTNYVVLGGILEKVTGQSIEQLFRERIARPAGMTHSTFLYEPRRSRQFATPYVIGDNGGRIDAFAPGVGMPSDYWGEVWTDGGLASTAPDLARFGDALFAGRLVSPATLALMEQFSGSDDYGFGLYAKDADGYSWIGHDGDYLGYESEDWHDPARHLTITVTTDLTESDNANDTISNRIWDAVAAAYDANS
jgi:D-alanyl-D-alanine carboxypeptidase